MAGTKTTLFTTKLSFVFCPFQRFNPQKDFSSHCVIQSRLIGQSAIPAASDDGLEGLDEGSKPVSFGLGRKLLKEGCCGSLVTKECVQSAAAFADRQPVTMINQTG